jgi:hypothetical protein
MTALRWIGLAVLAYGFLCFELGVWCGSRRFEAQTRELRAKAARVARRLA